MNRKQPTRRGPWHFAEVPAQLIPMTVHAVAEESYTMAQNLLEDEYGEDLLPPEVSFRWFRPDRHAGWGLSDTDVALFILNCPPIETTMLGKLTHREAAVHPPVIWLRATLGPIKVSEVVAHEARHFWQDQHPILKDCPIDVHEGDAHAWSTKHKRRFARLAREVIREINPSGGTGPRPNRERNVTKE